MPPSAAATRPCRAPLAPVNAPLVWPKSSLSMSASGTAPQLSVMRGFCARGARVVNRGDDGLFAGSALAGHEDGTSRTSNTVDVSDEGGQRLAVADDLAAAGRAHRALGRLLVRHISVHSDLRKRTEE